LIEKAV